MKRPWLSVVMPTYNGAAYIQQALASICLQDDPTIEVIIVDDGSTDPTLKIAAAFKDRLDISTIERQHHGNWVANTNLGMSQARGEYLCWLHQDDYWDPLRLGRLKQVLRHSPEADLVLHPSQFVTCSGQRVGQWSCPFPCRELSLQPREILAHLLVQCFVATCAPLFKSSAAAAIGGMDENMWFLGDWDYWLRLASLGVTAYHPGVLSSFRVHSESQTIARNGVAEDIRQQYATVFERHRTSFQDQPKAVWLAATLSMEVNLALAAVVAGKPPYWRPLASSFFRAGLRGGWRFLRDSRVVERCSSRMRAGLAKPRNQELIDHPRAARPWRRRLRRRAQMSRP